jgi:hypothetical protein
MAESDDSVKVSDVLNETKAYNIIGRKLGIEIDPNSTIFHDIEEYIVFKYREMEEENLENEDEEDY